LRKKFTTIDRVLFRTGIHPEYPQAVGVNVYNPVELYASLPKEQATKLQ